MPFTAPRSNSRWPDIDDRLVEPETRYEMHDGELVHVSPADRPHGKRHLQLAALLEAHTGLAFDAAVDVLTRTTEVDDFAPDVSVYPHSPGTDPGHQLEHLAFEVVSTQSLGHAGRKAAKLAARGIRRVFAIDVDRSRALEWSTAAGAWRELDPTGQIEDPALEVPLPIEAMIHAARADDAVARALVAKKNPVIEAVRTQDRAAGMAQGKIEGKIEGEIEGKIEGKIEALVAILDARSIELDAGDRDRILAERDPRRLDRWIGRAAIATTMAAVFGGE